jgi:hypothetical protein
MSLSITDFMAVGAQGTPRSSLSLSYFSLPYSWIGKFGRANRVEVALI